MQIDEGKIALETERAARLSAEGLLKSTEADRDGLITRFNAAQELIATKEAALRDVNSKLEHLASELDAVREERDVQSDRATELEIELSIVTKERTELDQRSEDYLYRLKALELEVDKREATLQEVTSKLEEREAELRSERESAHRLSEELDATRVESARKSMQIDELAAELAKTSDELANASDALKQTTAQARADVETHLHKLDELEQRHAQEYTALEEQVAGLNAELQVRRTLRRARAILTTQCRLRRRAINSRLRPSKPHISRKSSP